MGLVTLFVQNILHYEIWALVILDTEDKNSKLWAF